MLALFVKVPTMYTVASTKDPQTGRRTDGRTDSNTALALRASRGKNIKTNATLQDVE